MYKSSLQVLNEKNTFSICQPIPAEHNNNKSRKRAVWDKGKQ